MSNLSTQSTSPNMPPKSNGVEGSNGVEDENQPTQPTYPQRNYKLEDFSQPAINRGQQQINYLITVVDYKIVEALKQVSNAVAKCASNGRVDLGALDKAIADVSEATKEVATIFPPGCGTANE